MGPLLACKIFFIGALISQTTAEVKLNDLTERTEDVEPDSETRALLNSNCNCSDLSLAILRSNIEPPKTLHQYGFIELDPAYRTSYQRIQDAETGKHYWKLCKAFTSPTVSSVDCDLDWTKNNNMAAIWEVENTWYIGSLKYLFRKWGNFEAKFDETNSCPYTKGLKWAHYMPRKLADGTTKWYIVPLNRFGMSLLVNCHN